MLLQFLLSVCYESYTYEDVVSTRGKVGAANVEVVQANKCTITSQLNLQGPRPFLQKKLLTAGQPSAPNPRYPPDEDVVLKAQMSIESEL